MVGDLHGHIVQSLGTTRGDFAWVVDDPATGTRSEHQSDVPFPGASTLKLAVFVRLLQLVDAGTVRLDAKLRVREWHKCGGAGVLQYMAPNTDLRVDDLATLMIILSDNTATNVLLDLTGCAPASATIDDGRNAIRRYYGKPTMPVPDGQPYTAIATAAGLASIYRRALSGSILSPSTRDRFWQVLERQQDRALMPRFLSDTVRVAHKTGAIDGVRHDAGVFWVPTEPAEGHDPMAVRATDRPSGRPVICVALSRDLGDRSWSVENSGEAAIGRMARAAYEWFAANPVK
jgi:beta-lactamase class A